MPRFNGMTGRINSFQSLGTVDGPGVRCVVFMQGCPLRCVCCHNPETWDMHGGEDAESEALLKKILRFRSYFGNNGGVTLSGGEPLLQAAFCAELFGKLKAEGIHTALDTSGCVLNGDVERLLEVTDLVLLDHKYSSEEDYRRYTGGSLGSTERFLKELEKRNIPVWLRRVIIPGLNADEASVRALNAAANAASNIKKVELLPFENFCAAKYKALGIPFALADTSPPTSSDMDMFYSFLEKR